MKWLIIRVHIVIVDPFSNYNDNEHDFNFLKKYNNKFIEIKKKITLSEGDLNYEEGKKLLGINMTYIMDKEIILETNNEMWLILLLNLAHHIDCEEVTGYKKQLNKQNYVNIVKDKTHRITLKDKNRIFPFLKIELE